MLSYRSELKLDRDGRVSLPKIKASVDMSESPVRRASLMALTKDKMDAIMLKQIKPSKDVYESSSDGEEMLRKISTP